MANLVFKDHPSDWHCSSDYPKVPLTRISLDTAPDKAVAYVFFGHVNIDFDGSPTAYAPPEQKSPLPDDDLHNAWDNDNGWFGVLGLPPGDTLVKQGLIKLDQRPSLLHKGHYPVVQQAKFKKTLKDGTVIDHPGDPKPGYYLSTCSNRVGPFHLQDSYADASRVSYGALSTPLAALGFDFGDCGLVLRHDQDYQSGFYYLDGAGKGHKVGECSHKVGKNLGGSGRASHFNNNYPVSFLIFPGSSRGGLASFRSDDEIKDSLKPLVRSLSYATNAYELALLMTFNQVSPKTKPQGTAKLEAFRNHKGRPPNPATYNTIVRALKEYGWAAPFMPSWDMALGPYA
jgi:hypothetical protein